MKMLAFLFLSDACPEEVGIGGEGWGEEAVSNLPGGIAL